MSGPGGYITPSAWGVPTASRRGVESEVPHKWAGCLQNACPPQGGGGGTASQWGSANRPQISAISDSTPRSKAVGAPQGGSGSVATWPTCGSLVLSTPALKRCPPPPPRRRGLCSHPAQLWASSDILGGLHNQPHPGSGHPNCRNVPGNFAGTL